MAVTIGTRAPLLLTLVALPLRGWRRPAMNHPSGGDEQPGVDGAAVELARGLTQVTRDEIGRADNKAAVLLAGVLAVVGFVASSVLAGQWSPFRLASAAQVLWWLATAAVAIGLTLLCACLYPTVRRRGRDRAGREVVGYFGHVNAHGSGGELVAALRRRAAVPELERQALELLAVSGIAERKYLRIRLAIWALAAAGALVVAAAVVGWWIR
jgi:hypothetical protein